MTNTVIYISITHDDETLTVDGNLCLFGELLATLHDVARDLSKTTSMDILPIPDSNQEGSHVIR